MRTPSLGSQALHISNILKMCGRSVTIRHYFLGKTRARGHSLRLAEETVPTLTLQTAEDRTILLQEAGRRSLGEGHALCPPIITSAVRHRVRVM